MFADLGHFSTTSIRVCMTSVCTTEFSLLAIMWTDLLKSFWEITYNQLCLLVSLILALFEHSR